MPGIAGIFSRRPEQESINTLQVMVKAMEHEKFYSSGTFVNDQMGLRIGWVSHQDSFSDCLPIWNEKKDICLIFSGENAVDKSDIDALRARGHQFNSWNASYIVHEYEEKGIGFLEKLNGCFSGVVIDFRESKAILFNDRYGLNRIYYYENEKGLYFSSEAKSLLKVFHHLRQIDTTSLGEFFSCGCVMGNKTLFSDVSIIPGGSMWTISLGQQVQKRSYFVPNDWENQPQLSEYEYYEKLKDTFARILPRYCGGQDRVAMSLTGGIDTRMIMAWAKLPPSAVPCYTFGGIFRDCADVKIARQVAKICQQQHETIPVNGGFFSEFPELAKKTVYYTDGAMDVSGAVELFVNRRAREIAPIRLTGNYGDQVIRSAIGFKSFSLFEGVFDADFIDAIRAGNKTHAKHHQVPNLTFLLLKQLPWHHYARLSLERTQLTMRSPYLDNDLVALMYQAPPSLAKSRELSLRLISEGNPLLGKIPTDRGVLYRPIPVVTAAQNFFQEFTFRSDYAYDYGMPHWLTGFNHLFAPLNLDRLFLGRHKFYHYRRWYYNELSQYVKDILLDSRTLSRPYFNRGSLEKMVMDHVEGRRNYTTEIHWILTSELIQRHLIEQL